MTHTTHATHSAPSPARRRLVPARLQNPINRALNLALYLVLCFMVGTGLLLWIRLPPGQGRRHGGHQSILSMTRHEWGDWHLYAGLAFVALCLAHLLMNLAWLRKIAMGTHALRFWIGIALGLALIAWLALMPIDR